jgi:hypothetical protein
MQAAGKAAQEAVVIVFDLGCENNHRFEGWFSSSDDFEKQLNRKLISCPFCSNGNVVRLPHATHIRSGAKPRPEPAEATRENREGQQYANVGKDILAKLIEQIIEHTEDVGAAFPEEARKIHYQETPERRIRGTASQEEVEELVDEGIEVVPLPIPSYRTGKSH